MTLKLEFMNTLLESRNKQLFSLSPTAVIQRGYAVVVKNGKSVMRKSQVQAGDDINIHVSDGTIDARVITNR